MSQKRGERKLRKNWIENAQKEGEQFNKKVQERERETDKVED